MSRRSQQMQMGGFGIPPLTTGVKALGVFTIVVSIVCAVQKGLIPLLGFEPDMLRHAFWTPLTYTFVSPSPLDLILSVAFLWLMGASLEQMWGTRRFVIFYLVTGALAAVATFLLGLVVPSVARTFYAGNVAPLAAMAAAFAVSLPDATVFLYVVPIRSKWLLPICAGMTALFMIMGRWQDHLTALFGLGAGILLAGGVSPGHFWLRARVWWIDKRLKRSKLRVIKGDDKFGQSSRGSDKYLH